jgi:hypothetical protein
VLNSWVTYSICTWLLSASEMAADLTISLAGGGMVAGCMVGTETTDGVSVDSTLMSTAGLEDDIL